MADWQPIETAPKDRRILGFGVMGFEFKPSIATIIWDDRQKQWHCDPNEATEYGKESCEVTHWQLLPEAPING